MFNVSSIKFDINNIKKTAVACVVFTTPMIWGMETAVPDSKGGSAAPVVGTTYSRQEIGEYAAVQEIAAKFIEGVKTGNAEVMKPYFHEKAVMFGQYDAVKEAGSIQLLFDSLSKVGPCGGDYVARIDILALEKNAAVIKVIEDGWHGYDFTDFITALKIDGKWVAVAKVYDTLEKDKRVRSSSLSRPDIKEYGAVEFVARKFIEGVKTGNAEVMKPYFHEKAAMFGQYDEVREAGSIQLLFDSLSKVGPCGEDYTARVDVVALENNAAVVKVIEDGWHGYNFTDFLSMQKIDGQWKVVAKAYDTVSHK